MPNWVENAIELHGNEKDIEEAARLLKGANGDIDFDKIVPMPENVRMATDGRSETWAREHWGTKWNAFEIDLAADASGERSSIIGTFMTAWSAPDLVVQALSLRFPELEVSLQCTSDTTVEYKTYKNGIVSDESREELDCGCPEL